MKAPRALTIAGSDSGGGAGIQADLKTFAALGVHGMSVITAITAQNTVEVKVVQDVDLEVIRAQLEAVYSDIGVDAAKTGMLHTPEIIELVAEWLQEHPTPLVVDPVMVAKSGAALLKQEARQVLVEKLLPLATVVTPNLPEAQVLAGIEIRSLDDQVRAAARIANLGPEAVVVKGGHLQRAAKSQDLLYIRGEIRVYEAGRIPSKNTHGTGCVFSAAIAAGLAKGLGIEEAVADAKRVVTDAIKWGLELGRGHGPVNPTAVLHQEAERYGVMAEVRRAVELLEANPEVAELIPECQTNVVMALPAAIGPEDVCGIPGRMAPMPNGGVRAAAPPEFGASKHLARAVITAMKHDPRVRAAANIRYSERLVELCQAQGWTVASYDRSKEPPQVREREGATIPWGTEQAIRQAGRVPDVIYHTGAHGKEPMIVLLAPTATEAARRIIDLARALRE